MFKTKSHNAYIIIMINKESYIKKKSHNDSIKNHHDSRRLQNFSKIIANKKVLCYTVGATHLNMHKLGNTIW